MPTDPAPRTSRPSASSRYRPEPDEERTPPIVFCIAAGALRPDCVPGCWNGCWRIGDSADEAEPVPDTGAGLDLPF